METSLPWLVVFDLDGTLIDSSQDLCLAVNAALTHVGVPVLPQAAIAAFIGDGAATLMQRALQAAINSTNRVSDAQIDVEARFDSAFNHFLNFYREHKLDNTRLYEGVLPALEEIRLRAPHLPMAVLTNKPVRPSREICDALGLSPFFFANYGGDSFSSKKPDPEGLLALISEARALRSPQASRGAHLGPGGVVMVGDSAVDIQTARGAGAKSLGCRYGLCPEALDLAHPDLCCDSAAEWPRLLGLSA